MPRLRPCGNNEQREGESSGEKENFLPSLDLWQGCLLSHEKIRLCSPWLCEHFRQPWKERATLDRIWRLYLNISAASDNGSDLLFISEQPFKLESVFLWQREQALKGEPTVVWPSVITQTDSSKCLRAAVGRRCQCVFPCLHLSRDGTRLSLYLGFLGSGFLSPRGVMLQKVCLRRCFLLPKVRLDKTCTSLSMRETALKITPSLQRLTHAENVWAKLLLQLLLRCNQMLFSFFFNTKFTYYWKFLDIFIRGWRIVPFFFCRCFLFSTIVVGITFHKKYLSLKRRLWKL